MGTLVLSIFIPRTLKRGKIVIMDEEYISQKLDKIAQLYRVNQSYIRLLITRTCIIRRSIVKPKYLVQVSVSDIISINEENRSLELAFDRACDKLYDKAKRFGPYQ